MKKIAFVGEQPVLEEFARGDFSKDFELVLHHSVSQLLESLFTAPPDMILVDVSGLNPKLRDALAEIRSDPVCGHIPLVAVSGDVGRLESLALGSVIDDYVLLPADEGDCSFRLRLCRERASKILELNPLTRLPGNISIIKEMQRRLDNGAVFALAYADIDFFKPFNDRYGFSRGDEVIRMVARLILNITKMQCPNDSFIGHVGGDDFLFMVPFEEVEGVCGEVIRHFDSIVPSFYNPEDRAAGLIESTDRDGRRRSFSFITLSIGVAHNAFTAVRDYRRLSEVAAEMKKYAKTHPGSCFKVDRRKA